MKKNQKMILVNEKLSGGFASLNDVQLSKIKGGLKDLSDSTNNMCDNSGNCSGSTNTTLCEKTGG